MVVYDIRGAIDLPDDDQSLWRYMSLFKFIDLLQKKALFFCRTDYFDDSWEGVIPRSVLEQSEKYYAKKPLTKNTYAEHFRAIEIPRHVVSCWHQNDVEENLMWNAYCKDRESVAIQTDVKRFRAAFDDCKIVGINNGGKDVLAGTVSYDDHREWQASNAAQEWYATIFFFKRVFYKGENEFRAMVDLADQEYRGDLKMCALRGVHLTVDVKQLVQKVVVAPHSPAAFLETVKCLCGKFGFPEMRVEPSVVNQPPPH